LNNANASSPSWAVVTRLTPRGLRRTALRFLLRIGTRGFLEVACAQSVVLILNRKEAGCLRQTLMLKANNSSILSSSAVTDDNQPNPCAERLAATATPGGLIYNLPSKAIAFRVVRLLKGLWLDRSATVLPRDAHIYWVMDDESWQELLHVMDETLHPDESTVAELVLQDLNAFVR